MSLIRKASSLLLPLLLYACVNDGRDSFLIRVSRDTVGYKKTYSLAGLQSAERVCAFKAGEILIATGRAYAKDAMYYKVRCPGGDIVFVIHDSTVSIVER